MDSNHRSRHERAGFCCGRRIAGPNGGSQKGLFLMRYRWFESISLQQRVRRNRWLGNACGAGTMLQGAPTVHLGIKHFQGTAAGVGWQRACDVIISIRTWRRYGSINNYREARVASRAATLAAMLGAAA